MVALQASREGWGAWIMRADCRMYALVLISSSCALQGERCFSRAVTSAGSWG